VPKVVSLKAYAQEKFSKQLNLDKAFSQMFGLVIWPLHKHIFILQLE
jgi:hypothetical protein